MAWRDPLDDASTHDFVRQLAVAPLADGSVGIGWPLAGQGDDLAHLLRCEARRSTTPRGIGQPLGDADCLQRHVPKRQPAPPPMARCLVIQVEPTRDLGVVQPVPGGQHNARSHGELLTRGTPTHQALQLRPFLLTQHNLRRSWRHASLFTRLLGFGDWTKQWPRSIGGFRFGSEGAMLGVVIDPKLLATLRSFRQELYDDLGLRQDSLFELVDAVLTAPERRTLVRLSLCPCFRRRWPSTCDALADGTLDVGGLRALFQAHVPLPGPGERPLWVVDGTHWPRPAAATSPARTWEYRPLPGKPQQGVVPAWAYQWLVQVPEPEGSWVLPLDVQPRGPTAGTPTQVAIRQIAHARAGQAPEALRPVVGLDSAYDVGQLALV